MCVLPAELDRLFILHSRRHCSPSQSVQSTCTNGELGLMAVTSLLTAAKYSMTRCAGGLPNNLCERLLKKAGGCFSRAQVVQAECNLLATLSFDISGPTAWGFVERFTQGAESCDKTRKAASEVITMALIWQDSSPWP